MTCLPLTLTRVTLAAALSVASAPPLLAQATAYGAITGAIADEQGGGLANVQVTATGTSGSRRFHAVTDTRGFYRCLDLPPDTYTLSAQRDGFSTTTRAGLIVRSGLTLTVHLSLRVGPVSQHIDVVAETPLLDTRRGQRATNISGDLSRSLPLNVTRHWADVLTLVPGATLRSLTALSSTYAVRGSDVGSNVIQVDGAEAASAATGTTAGVTLVPAAIDDMQTVSGPADASAPLGAGANVSIAIKSGTNTLRGAAGLDVQHRTWNSDNTADGTSEAIDAVLPEATLGGPLVRDRIWLFGGYRYERVRQRIHRTADQLRTLEILAPGFSPFDRRVESQAAVVKVTAAASPRQRIEATYQLMPRDTFNAAATDAGLFGKTSVGGYRTAGVRLLSTWGSSVTTRLSASYNDNDQQNVVGRDLPAQRIFSTTIASGGRLTGSSLVATLGNGGTGLSGLQAFSRSGISGDIHMFRSNFAGQHELQAGVSFQRNHEASTARFANGGFAREEAVLRDPSDPAAGIIPFWREIWDVDLQPTGLGNSDDVGLHVQDAWSPVSQLTITAGVRADVIRRVDDLFDAIVQDGTAIGPRIAVNYALTASGRQTVRASWGRLHDVLSTSRAAAGAASAGKTDLYDLNLDGTFETSFKTPASTAASRNRIFDPSRGQPFVDDLSVAYSAQLPRLTSVDVAFIRREYKHRMAAVEVNGLYDDGVFRGYRDETQNEIYEVTDNRWNRLVYHGLDLHAARNSRVVDAVVGYTRAFGRIAGTWQPNDPASFLQPGAFGNTKGIGGVRAPIPQDANSLSGTHMTADNQPWADHVVRAGISWRAPRRLIVATTYMGQSGAWSGPIVTRLSAPDTSHGPATIRLSSGRVVSNPLATTLRFAYATRSDGQLRAPFLHVWHVRLGRRLALAHRRTLDFSADIFNIVNAGRGTAFRSPGGNQTFSPEFGTLTAVQPPRAVRLRLGWEF